jgi:hypothetical protein
LAAQAVLWHQRHEQQLLGRLEEPLDLDGLRQLVQSVHQMAEINTLYTAHSGFCLALSAFAIRHGVGKDPLRLERRELSEARWGKPDPAARIKAVGARLARIEPRMRRGIVLELRTDLVDRGPPEVLPRPRHRLAERSPTPADSQVRGLKPSPTTPRTLNGSSQHARPTLDHTHARHFVGTSVVSRTRSR